MPRPHDTAAATGEAEAAGAAPLGGWSPLRALLAAGLAHLTAEADRRELTDGEQRWRRTARLAVAILDAGHDLPASLSENLADLPEERHRAPSRRR